MRDLLEAPGRPGGAAASARRVHLAAAVPRATGGGLALEELGRQIDRELRGPESAADVRRRMSAGAPAAATGGGRRCPVCGSTTAPVRKAKGSTLVLVLLLLLWIVPGVLYLIFYQGQVWACPTCGAKLSDAT